MAYANSDYIRWNHRYERLKAIRETILNQPKPDLPQPELKGTNVNIDDLYPSKYLKSEDLKGRRVQCVIDSVEVEEMSDGTMKPCLIFKGRAKTMVLNKTNADTLKAAFGAETNDWQGRKVELFTQQVAFKGQQTQGLRLSPVLDRQPGEDDEPDF